MKAADPQKPKPVTCPVCMYDPGEPTDPLGLCRKHRQQLEDLKERDAMSKKAEPEKNAYLHAIDRLAKDLGQWKAPEKPKGW